MGSQNLFAKAKALAEDDGADETRNTGIDVHNGTAGEVECALVEEPAVGGIDCRGVVAKDQGLCRVIGCRRQLGEEVRGCRFTHCGLDCVDVIGAQGEGIGASPPPDHMGHGQIGESEPKCEEQQNGRELHAFGKGADDEGRGNGREGKLEHDIGEFRHVGFLGEGSGQRIVVHTRQHELGEAADEGVAVGEGQRVSVNEPAGPRSCKSR